MSQTLNFDQIKNSIGDWGKDIRLNLESVLTPEGAQGLSENQILGIALASAYASRNKQLTDAIQEVFSQTLTPEFNDAAKAAAIIMAMNNIYYRSSHYTEDAEVMKLPARLRMNVIGKPGIDKVDFELMSLAVSAINGCNVCVKSHTHEVRKAGISTEGIHSVLRIASVISATAQALGM